MDAKIYFLFMVFAVPVVFSDDSDDKRYCFLSHCPPEEHTLCAYPHSKPAKRCGRVVRVGLYEKEKEKILQVHNDLRSKVYNGSETRGHPGPQPEAVYDVSLEWDNELARIAERWAIQCRFHGDICRNVEDYFVGQNILLADYDEDMNREMELDYLKELVETWYDEVDRFNKDDVAKFRAEIALPSFTASTIHYTQMIWGDTFKLGCSAIRFFKEIYPVPKIFLVCNYGPAGNIENEPVYEVAQ